MINYIQRLDHLSSLDAFFALAKDVESYLAANVVKKTSTTTASRPHYQLWIVNDQNNRPVRLRPLNTNLLLLKEQLDRGWELLQTTLPKLSSPRNLTGQEKRFLDNQGLDKTLYTISQLMGCGMDALVANPNQARKLFGMKYEDLIHFTLQSAGLQTKSTTFRKQVPGMKAKLNYTLDIDLVIRKTGKVLTSGNYLDPGEIISSIKTSSKDRMQKIFVDKTLLERISGVENIKFVAIFHNDVQRSGNTRVSTTFVAKLFLIYWELLTEVAGVYYMDPPSHMHQESYKGKIKWFSDFIRFDVWKMI